MTSSVAPVLVAGAGPSGLVTALTLLQNNVPVRIITKELEYRLGQRGSGVWPRTFEVFHFLRALETHQSARPVLPLREYKPGTLEPIKTIITTPCSDPTPSVPYSNPMYLGQPMLEGILRSHIEKYGCTVELGTELLSFEDDGERVLAKLIIRNDGKETYETFEASFLVGADGAKGVTRKHLGLTFLGETMQDFGFLVGDLCLEIEGVDRKHRHIFGDRSSSFFTLRPTDEIAPDGFQFMITTKNYEPQQLVDDQNLMARCMSELTGHEINIRKADALSVFRPNVRMVDKFGSSRVFIVGDAAHVHTPTGGQGLNTGIQDAFNLTWKLSLVHKGFSPVSLLDSYTTERVPVIAEMLHITTGSFHRLRSASTIEGAMQYEKKMNMLGVNCRFSPIVLDEFTPAGPVNAYGVLEEGVLVAGDRAPDATKLELMVAQATGGVVTETRLFDVFCPTQHTVLVFVPHMASSTDVLEALSRHPKNVIRPVIVLPQGTGVTAGAQLDVVFDRGGYAYGAYLVDKGEKKVVVVRPDGVVGAMVRGASGVEVYFSRVLAHKA